MRRVVLLHGFCGGPFSWRDVVRGLDSTVTTTIPTIGGHLGTPSPSDLDSEIDRIAASLRASKFDHATICGYSLGGRLALGLLARHEQLVDRLVLVGANPGLVTDEERRTRASADEAWAHLLESEGIIPFLERWEAQPLFASQARLPPAVRQTERAERQRHDPSGLAGAMRTLGLARMPSYWSAIASAQVPIEYVAGGEDAKFTSLGRRVVAEAKTARLTIVDGAGHNVVLERPDAIASLIASRA